MWLKIVYNNDDINKWPTKPKNIGISLDFGISSPITSDMKTFRVSPIFPLVKNNKIKSIENISIYFFNFDNAYRVLGSVNSKGSDELKNSLFFSTGLSSIILITSETRILKEFRRIVKYKEYAFEKWIIKDSRINKIDYSLNNNKVDIENLIILDYEKLSLTERSLIDEFKIGIKLFLIKMAVHMTEELNKIKKLITEINILIIELIYLTDLKGEPPSSLSEYSFEDFNNNRFIQVIRQQNLDKIIQINSALSLVSTQAFSGAIPILERRSIIRRNSLLGIGSAILALNRITRFIEDAFSKIPINDIITKFITTAAPLNGLDRIPSLYDPSDWNDSSIDIFDTENSPRDTYIKLPYFSGRLGFRETEYSISAAIQSISNGANLEWSLMTITHEMLHGHVRVIIDSIFYGSEKLKEQENWNNFYENFKQNYYKTKKGNHLIDSIRNIILSYCCLTQNFGSLTSDSIEVPTNNRYEVIDLPKQKELWSIFEDEHRNICEIFVHILDLHYFYASRVSVYIPLIWSSWVSVPHVGGNLREYILRSLLVIASEINDNPIPRFNLSIERFIDILQKHQDNKLKNPIIRNIIEILNDKDLLQSSYFPAFKVLLIIVDLVKKVFKSEKIRGDLFKDDFVKWNDDEENFEQSFVYRLYDEFNDEFIESPIAYMLDRMIKELNSSNQIDDYERETTMQFLALNSKS